MSERDFGVRPTAEGSATLRVVSHGGGRQTTALLVLAAQGKVDFRTFVFANVGDDSENPGTLRYLADVARPYAEAHGIAIHEVRRLDRKGRPFPTIREHVMGPVRSIAIPVRVGADGAPGNRKCTPEWKIKVVSDWCAAQGATSERPAVVAVGFSTDEMTRANSRRPTPHEQVVYPLLDLGLSLHDCLRLIADAGLPVPPKSSCSFCPFRLPEDFRRMARDDPDEFERVCELEEAMLAKRTTLGRDPAYLTRFGRPLRQVVANAGTQFPLALYEEDEGYRCGDVCAT